ncbi:MAG: serine/threonine-protein phosphatase [Bacteroidia bacterium]|nr:serine/threonine-protein phosphatase [Bacteroidia bacterium]MDW8300846.1 PP2C family protein-serine/threonine phosphatase [Bacteroidia bacterium]
MLFRWWKQALNNGIHEGLELLTSRQVKTVNGLNTIASLFLIGYVLINLFTKNYQALFLDLAILGLVCFPIYWLHRQRKYTYGKVWAFFTVNILLMLVATVNELNRSISNTSVILIGLSVLSVLLFDGRAKYFAAFFAFLCYVFSHLTFLYIANKNFNIENVLYMINAMVAIAIIFTITNLYKEDFIASQRFILERNEEIEQRNADMIESISYAERIQKALLPQEQNLAKFFPNSFISYLPKHIISGDFYWFASPHLQHPPKTENSGIDLFLAVADCTGHGVPGAFMTIIGITLLDQIVNQENIHAPAEILHKLDERLVAVLQQESNLHHEQALHDGMDIALIKINLPQGKVTFAGAKRPLWIIHKNSTELEVYKGDKFPIGSTQYKNKKFTEKHLTIHKEDRLYLFSDGYADQFGIQGKFTVSRFKELLLSQTHLEMSIQKSTLERNFQQWKGEEEQTDDVLVIGIEI